MDNSALDCSCLVAAPPPRRCSIAQAAALSALDCSGLSPWDAACRRHRQGCGACGFLSGAGTGAGAAAGELGGGLAGLFRKKELRTRGGSPKAGAIAPLRLEEPAALGAPGGGGGGGGASRSEGAAPGGDAPKPSPSRPRSITSPSLV
jgi:hypothetical protein